MKPATRRVVILAASVLLIGSILQFAGAMPAVESFTARLTSPILRPVRSVVLDTKNIFGAVFRIGQLGKENNELKNRLATLTGNSAELAELRLQNEALKVQLGVSETKRYALLPTHVLVGGGVGYEETLVLDRGERDGVSKGMLVVVGNNLIGRITSVGPSTSSLQLVSSPNSAIIGQVVGKNATGVIKGRLGAGVLGMEQIELGKKIEIGDIIASSRIAADTIPGLVVGVVENVIKNDNAVFQSATVRPILDFNSLDLVFIVTGKK